MLLGAKAGYGFGDLRNAICRWNSRLHRPDLGRPPPILIRCMQGDILKSPRRQHITTAFVAIMTIDFRGAQKLTRGNSCQMTKATIFQHLWPLLSLAKQLFQQNEIARKSVVKGLSSRSRLASGSRQH